ncbi:MAG: low molecular weight protein arginine phosphatase [Nitrospinae bacterium]|nr:low molecular weight protein arginine phosphatase [Nitrospinota bacterium]
MKRVLIVCTGNICRSPMAVGLLQKNLADKGVDGVEIQSTGIAALVGRPAEPLVHEALKPFGTDVSGHRAQMISEELIQWADCILVMTQEHRDFVRSMAPEAIERVWLLGAYGPGDDPDRGIPDPYGGSAFHYRACAVELQEALNGFLASDGLALGG